MDTIVKVYLDLFIFLIFMIFGVQLIILGVTARSADSYLEATADRISCSHFSDEVITTCKDDAKNRFAASTGVADPLVVTVSERGSSGIKYGHIELTYNVKIMMFGISKNYTIQTDVR